MRKSLAYFFLSCSLILVLGHSLLPHNHIEKDHAACAIKQVKNLSITEILKLALAHNLGTNHLEEFKNCKKLEFTQAKSIKDFISAEDLLAIEIIEFPTLEKRGKRQFHSSVIELILKDAPLRAPPSLA